MYLSKLQLLGFKSFAQKTKLEFNDGISCIIGPNGSGKSNIVDAVRWVLGEQKVTSLRSDKMENVIFNGTNKRKPMGIAEVSMTIQNDRKILKTEYDEVVIARRLYRSGESQYLLNKTPVRLKDIMDIFVDSGLGSNSYSVIELKMVESILSDNKNERRELFEEAAGVVKYKTRRRSALRKLEHTRTDLTRINDIISEVQHTVNSLSRQVGKARRYLRHKEDLKKAEIDLARYRYNRMMDEIRPLKKQLEEISKIKEESYHQITIDEALLEDYKNELLETERKVQDINRRLNEKDQKINNIKREEAVAQTKAQEVSKTRERYQQEIESFKRKIELLDEQIEQYQQELEEMTADKDSVDEEYRHIESERREEMERLKKVKGEIDALNNRFKQQHNALLTKKEALKQKEYQLQFQEEQQTQLTQRLQEIDERLKQLEHERSELLDSMSEKETALKQHEQKRNHRDEAIQSLENQKNNADREVNRLQGQLQRVESQKSFLQQIIQNYEGYAKSTQYVMQHKKQWPELHAPLSELMSVEDGLAPLLETLLGEALDFLVVDSVTGARNLIRDVTENQQGRVTVIPLQSVNQLQPRPIKEPSDKAAARIADQVQCDEAYRNLIEILIGDVLLVEDLDAALRLNEQNSRLRFITRKGETLNFNGAISGGTGEQKSASVIGRKDQLAAYQKEADQLQKQLEKAQAGLEQFDNAITKERRQREEDQEAFESIYKVLTELEKKQHQIDFESEQLQTEYKDNEKRLAQSKQAVKDLRDVCTTQQTSIEKEQQALDELEKKTISRSDEYEKQSDALSGLLEDVQNARLKVTNLQNQIDNRRNDIERARKNRQELNNDIEHREKEIKEIGQLLDQIEKDSKERREQQETIWEKRGTLEDEHASVDQQYNEIKDKIKSLEDQARQYRKQHDSSMEKSRKLEMQINENRYKAENIREHMLDEYGEDIEVGIPYEDLNVEETQEQIELLKSRIKNLGAVNPLAVNEYEKEKERLDFLTKQRDDLLEAEKSLVETINKINRTARDQFVETFEKIKVNFENVFRSFFVNGEGSIQLEENEDPLEADIGIHVRTKGKRLQTLSLLSGGEKTLTAISLLFAIYLVKPSPFCILDEVDAPLDDVNITRFTEALKQFSEKTQFIIVTHNKRTMEAAETMYGVTMEEEGISKLVSVKFK